jgi:hypothetical protein
MKTCLAGNILPNKILEFFKAVNASYEECHILISKNNIYTVLLLFFHIELDNTCIYTYHIFFFFCFQPSLFILLYISRFPFVCV